MTDMTEMQRLQELGKERQQRIRQAILEARDSQEYQRFTDLWRRIYPAQPVPQTDFESATDSVVGQVHDLLDLAMTREAVPPAVACQMTEAVDVISGVLDFLPGASTHLRVVAEAMAAVRDLAVAEIDRTRA
ncbi:hypothetical protein ACFXEL_35005 [Streptomyces sp. NPDC059382]|uniref:hypothetical protein n=1 Tax=Streptomyces sp. NPDC059382 TaxID=3346816 RepID=UPI0036BD677D